MRFNMKNLIFFTLPQDIKKCRKKGGKKKKETSTIVSKMDKKE